MRRLVLVTPFGTQFSDPKISTISFPLTQQTNPANIQLLLKDAETNELYDT